LIDFFGAENSNIKEIAKGFPKCKILSRGSEIRVQGSSTEIVTLNTLFNNLIAHYNRYGQITLDNVRSYMAQNGAEPFMPTTEDAIFFGNGGVSIRPRNENQEKLVKAITEHDLVFALGPAGTGKTYISVALAVRALKNKEVKKIIITRPAVEAGENLGFLPGDLKEKIDPYLRPIYDALEDMFSPDKLKFYIESNVIEIAPLAFMRGRTLHKAFVLLDEAQNTTAMQMKMFLTRLGPGSKMIVTGDLTQIDLPKKVRSGLVESIEVLKDIPEVGFVYMHARDVVRHSLVRRIISAYDNYTESHRYDRP
jgi:phosphate starvation-inducible PhoH-like protein